MKLCGVFAAVAVMCVYGADGLPSWSGEALRTGWSHYQCTPSYGPEGLTLESRGYDPFVTTPRFNLEKPSNLLEVVIRAKPAEGWPDNYTPADIGRGPYPVADEDGAPVKPYGGLQWR